MRQLTTGLTGEYHWIVSEAMTAASVGSGLVRAFSTPMLVALMENAAVAALEGTLDDHQTTVGTRIDVRHLAATPVGMEVRAEATLKEIDGRRLVFAVTAWDGVEKIGEATHERFIVDRARFEARLAQKR